MKQDERIETMLRSAARGFRGSLNLFYPSVGRNGFNERNITFQLAHAFVTAKGHAFFEVPFKAKGKHRTDNHFDACLFDESICVLVEAKRLYSSEKNDSVIADIKRLRTHGRNAVARAFEDMDAKAPKRLTGLIVAEHWQVSSGKQKRQDVLEWWREGTGTVKWTAQGYPDSWTYNTLHVKTYDENGGQFALHWLYGYGALED